jgi:glutamate transport system substrate-binding protein
VSGLRLAAFAGCLLLTVTACAAKDADSKPQSAVSPTQAHGPLLGKAVLKIGVNIDQPGTAEIVNGDPNNRRGFDIDVANYVARALGAKKIEWLDVYTQDREKVLQTGEADLVIATYAISQNRMEKVSFAGPYILSGQDILIRAADVGKITELASLRDRRTCTATNSTSSERLVMEFGKGWDLPEHHIRLDTSTQCINELLAGNVDAFSTGNIILLGYAAEQPDRLRVVGRPFTVDNVGIGVAKDDTLDVAFINHVLQQMIDDGTWAASVRRHFGAGVDLILANTPTPGKLKPSWSIPG